MRRIAAILMLTALPAVASEVTQFPDLTELQDHLLSGGPARDAIPAMTNPEFDPADEVTWIDDEALVIGVVRNGVAKAYPEALGWWHEIINDEIGGDYVSVTLCPLTATPMVFDATDDDGSQIEFGVSGLLINSNLVMYDRRDDTTLYPQVIYTGINGDYFEDQLELLPAIETTFGMWKKMYPASQVARFGTGLERYTPTKRAGYQDVQRFSVYPYGDYQANNGFFIAPLTTGEPDFSYYVPKEIVTGVCLGDAVRAYPFADMVPTAVVNDTLGGEPLLVVFDLESEASIPYSRTVAGRTLTFYQVEAEGELPVAFRDVETGTRWDMLGRAVDGPLAGEQLRQLPAHNAMWFSWNITWPQSSVWEKGRGIIDEPPPVTAVLEPQAGAAPEDYSLAPAFPNPFNPSTKIRFSLARPGEMTLRVYNTTGQQVRSLADGRHAAGRYEVAWDGVDDGGRAVASGAYLVRLEVPGAGVAQTRRVTLLR